ncbi:putative RNA recognition motif domain, nucleotide-binding alpha-beta plait domain superfamily [Helianthus annuus]|nr:putative RNA recognition motif domain, nucleotide-binding alpha-beta plait domain superfamily [Helianthus annuus]
MGSKRSDYGDGASPGKIFIGGLAKETTIDTFVKYFGKYGEITDSVIMKDRLTGRPRGFGFITYADPSVVDTVIAETHVISGKQVEIKRTIPKGSAESKDFKTKKIFVGGIPAAVTEDEFKEFFSKYGKVSEHEIIRDHVTKRPRGFGFIVFESEQAVDEILANGNMIDMNGTQVEIKKAEPKKSSNSGINSYNREPKGRGYGGSYDGFDDSYGGYGGGGGGYGPPPYRSFGGPPSRFGDYGPYGPGASEFGGRYGDYGGDYGGYRGGQVAAVAVGMSRVRVRVTVERVGRTVVGQVIVAVAVTTLMAGRQLATTTVGSHLLVRENQIDIKSPYSTTRH